MKKTKLLLAGVLAAVVLTGCSDNTVQTGQTDPSRPDKAGPPDKVLTLGPNCTELFAALGLQDVVIGSSLNNHSRGPLPEYADAVGRIPEMNYGSATREAVLTSGADFIYGIDWEFGDAGLDLQELERSGMTVYQNTASTLEEIYREISDIGTLFEIPDRSEALVGEMKSRIETVRRKAAGEQPVRVLVYDSGNDGVFTCGGGNFESLLIETAGGKNLFEDITDRQWTTVSYEEVLKRQPDVIVIHDYDTPSAEEKIAEIKANPALSQLACVQEQRFVVITLESVLPGVRAAYAAELLHEGFFGG